MSITGLEGIFDKMAAKQAEAHQAMEVAILRLALLVERIAKDEYVPVISGRLKASIGGQSAPAPQMPGDALFQKLSRGDVFEVLVGSNVVYASVIEFGRNPSASGSKGSRAEFARDVTATSRTKTIGNGRHGPFLGPALTRANEVGLPVIREVFRKALGLT